MTIDANTMIHILGCIIVGGIFGYFITKKILTTFVGIILVYKAKDGRRYRVLQKPHESEKDAVARLRTKVKNAGTS